MTIWVYAPAWDWHAPAVAATAAVARLGAAGFDARLLEVDDDWLDVCFSADSEAEHNAAEAEFGRRSATPGRMLLMGATVDAAVGMQRMRSTAGAALLCRCLGMSLAQARDFLLQRDRLP